MPHGERVFKAADAHKLEDPERRQWLPPAEAVAAAGVQPSDVIADIGAGTGYFAVPLAVAAAQGRVYAVDFQPAMLDFVRAKAATLPEGSIVAVHGSAEHTTLPPASCDLLFVANVWHELDFFDDALREWARVLKPGGRLAVLDWRPECPPPPGPPAHHRVSAASVASTLACGRWIPQEAVNVGQYHYVLVAHHGGKKRQ